MVVIAMFIAILYAGKIVKTEEEKNIIGHHLYVKSKKMYLFTKYK